jgi:chemotaxis signal transduction protein
MADGVDARYVRGSAKLKGRLLILMDVGRLLTDEDVGALDDLKGNSPKAKAAAKVE